MRHSKAVSLAACLAAAAMGALAGLPGLTAEKDGEPALRGEPAGSPGHSAAPSQAGKPARIKAERVKKDKWIAYRLAKAPWIDKAASADPSIVEAICGHAGPARLLAGHRHIGEVADADHYLCRRLTRWRGATWALIHNPSADRVIGLDPEGIYRAIKRDPKVARILARHLMFDKMVAENPELGKVVGQHM